VSSVSPALSAVEIARIADGSLQLSVLASLLYWDTFSIFFWSKERQTDACMFLAGEIFYNCPSGNVMR
jgi:hypothetical protein